MTWLLVFAAMFAADFAWAKYVSNVKDGDALRSGAWAVALFLLGAAAVIGYTTDPYLLIPASLGAFAGTYAGVRMHKT